MRYKITQKNKNDTKMRYKRSQMHKFIDINNFKHVAEIGVFRGEFFRTLTKSNASDIVAVDPWDRVDINTTKLFCGDKWNLTKDDMKLYCDKFCVEHKNDDRVTIHKMFSEEASRLYKDSYFDFVYIDACHDYDNVLKDAKLWACKVRPGGVIGGHDYSRSWPGCVRAVNEFAKNRRFQLFYDATWIVRL